MRSATAPATGHTDAMVPGSRRISKAASVHRDHTGLWDMRRERIDDRALLHVIRKELQAGILERDGGGVHPETGTPQGGTVSPVRANGS